jgi:putative inorganic carbon (HCO3(-)) transporter
VTLGIATTVLALIALVSQVRVAGRLSQQVGQFANPNDLAQALLLGSPLLFLLGDAGGNPFRRIVITATLMPVLLALAQTGSRAAMLALACMMVYVFLRISPVKRLILVLVMAAASVTIVGLLPDTVRSRLTKLAAEEEVMSDEDEMAVASGAARLEILKQAVKLTLHHPIFGVGPGVFQHAAVIDSNSQGKRAMWRETHNTYVQVSSETGFPGLFLYCATLWVCYRELKSIRIRCQDNPKLAELYAIIVCFSTSLIGFLVTSAFSSIAYAFLLPALLGIAGSLIMAAKQELVLADAEDPQPVEEASRKGDVRAAVPPQRARTTAIGSPRPATALERHLEAMKQRRVE